MLTSQQIQAKQAALEYFRPISRMLIEERQERLRRVSPPIFGVGIGEEGVRVYTDVDRLRRNIPDEFEGLSTYLVQTTGFRAKPPIPSPQRTVAGTPCGVSVGHINITAGTIGCLVERDEEIFILSNNHVLADENRAAVNDPIVQPGPADGGSSPRDDVAELADYVLLDFSGGTNNVDAAIAELYDPYSITPDIAVIGYPAATNATAFVGQQVCKHGRTTGYTTGIVVDESFDGLVTYDQDRAWFEDQVVVRNANNPFSLGGDSGSLIVEEESLEPVALLFAGDGTMTLANPIDQVLNEFDVTIVN